MTKAFPRNAILAILLLASRGAGAQDLAAWIPSTRRAANPLIGEVLVASPLEQRVRAAQALGLREDPYVVDLIGLLVGCLEGSARHEDELVLRVLLASVFPRSLAPGELQRRIEVNMPAMELLAGGLDGYGLGLARETYRLLSAGANARFAGALAAEGRRLGAALGEREGRSDVEQADRLVAYLEAAGNSGDPALAGNVVSILETTRTPEVGRAARRVLGLLLPASRGAPPGTGREASDRLRTGAENPAGW